MPPLPYGNCKILAWEEQIIDHLLIIWYLDTKQTSRRYIILLCHMDILGPVLRMTQ